jgi:hypothetical protein
VAWPAFEMVLLDFGFGIRVWHCFFFWLWV